jgi:hypothetical protein
MKFNFKTYCGLLFMVLLPLGIPFAITSQSASPEGNETRLISTVRYLSEEIGERSFRDLPKLNRTADYIENSLRSFGCLVSRQAFTYEGRTYYNVIGEVKGSHPDIRTRKKSSSSARIMIQRSGRRVRTIMRAE